MSFDEDLARWEAGELSIDELATAYPDEDVRGIASVHAAFAGIAREPVPDASASWERLGARLPARARVGRARRRAIVIGLAAAMLMGSAIAYAAAPSGVRGVVRTIVNVFRDEQPAAPPTGGAPSQVTRDDERSTSRPAPSGEPSARETQDADEPDHGDGGDDEPEVRESGDPDERETPSPDATEDPDDGGGDGDGDGDGSTPTPDPEPSSSDELDGSDQSNDPSHD